MFPAYIYLFCWARAKFNTRVEALGNAVQQMSADLLAMSNQELYAAGVDAMLDFFVWNKLIGAIGRVIPPAQQALVRAADTLKSKGDKATAAEVATALGKAEATAAQLPRVVEQTEGLLVTIVAEAQATQEALGLGEAAIKALPKISLVGYDQAFGNLDIIEEAANMFKNVKGALGTDGTLLRFLRFGKIAGHNRAKGAAWELEKAHQLSKKGNVLLEFGGKVGSKKAEFDIICKNLLVECKNINWIKQSAEELGNLKKQFLIQKEMALEVGMKFAIHSKNTIHRGMQDWFKTHGIRFIEG